MLVAVDTKNVRSASAKMHHPIFVFIVWIGDSHNTQKKPQHQLNVDKHAFMRVKALALTDSHPDRLCFCEPSLPTTTLRRPNRPVV